MPGDHDDDRPGPGRAPDETDGPGRPQEPQEPQEPVDPHEPGAKEREAVAEGDEEAVTRYVDSPGAGLAGALDDLPEPNEPG